MFGREDIELRAGKGPLRPLRDLNLPLIGLSLLAACFTFAVARAGEIQLWNLPSLGKNIDAFPRIAGGLSPALAARINTVLADADHKIGREQTRCQRDTKGSIERAVDVTMSGPDFVSFLAHDTYYCSNSINRRVPFTFDLTSGALVDWNTLLPGLRLHKTRQSQPATIRERASYTSKTLSIIFLKAWRQARAVDGKLGDADSKCLGSLDSDPLSFILWLDPAHGGAMAEPDSPQQWTGACGEQLPIPLESLKGFGASARLFNALTRGLRGSPAVRRGDTRDPSGDSRA